MSRPGIVLTVGLLMVLSIPMTLLVLMIGLVDFGLGSLSAMFVNRYRR